MRSLISTLLGYLALVSLLTVFVAVTGIIGALLIVMVVVVLLAYFYGGFKIIAGFWGKGRTF
ncbi:MAG: hypothetical protein HZB37_02415 [Planctomycetes bacterium]|nr:hypothetical protein [Planctomycetota bacterium]